MQKKLFYLDLKNSLLFFMKLYIMLISDSQQECEWSRCATG